MSDKQVVNLDFLDREAQLYRNSKETLKTTGELVNKTIIDNTKKEVEDVQNAIKKLNEKVDKIMETDFIKNHQKTIESSQKQMSESIKKASDAFFKVRTLILEKQGLTDQQKQQYIKKLYDKIIDNFMTKEEKDFFERLIRGNGIVIMGGMGGMGGIGGIGGMGGMRMLNM